MSFRRTKGRCTLAGEETSGDFGSQIVTGVTVAAVLLSKEYQQELSRGAGSYLVLNDCLTGQLCWPTFLSTV